MNLTKLFAEPFREHEWNEPLTFGKYNGRRLSEVFLMDPGYLLWLMENTTRLYLSPELREVAAQRQRILSRTYSKIEQGGRNHVDRPRHNLLTDLRRRLVRVRRGK